MKTMRFPRALCSGLVLAASISILIGCAPATPGDIEVGKLDPQTKKIQFSSSKLQPTFEDGTPVTEVTIEQRKDEKIKDRFYLVRRGKTSKGDCRMTSTPVQQTPSGSFMYRMSGGGPGGLGDTESCSGDPCSLCHFDTEPITGAPLGCKCSQFPLPSGAKCNHTITRTPKAIFIY